MFKPSWRVWIVVSVLLLGGWMSLLAHYAPRAESEFNLQPSLLILLPAVWREVRPGLPGSSRY